MRGDCQQRFNGDCCRKTIEASQCGTWLYGGPFCSNDASGRVRSRLASEAEGRRHRFASPKATERVIVSRA